MDLSRRCDGITEPWPESSTHEATPQYVSVSDFTALFQIYDNRDVVAYCKYLSVKYDCHLNVEMCVMVTACRYIFKYVFKGNDRAELHVEVVDEIKEFIDGRYICPPEGMHRILEFPIQEKSHSVVVLAVSTVLFQK